MTTYRRRSEAEIIATMQAAGLDTSDPADVAFIVEWDNILSEFNAEELEALREALQIMQDMTPAEWERFRESRRLAELTPEAARGVIVEALERGEEPDGKALGDWLQVDPALQAFFRRTMQALWEPDTVLHLQPMGHVLAA